MNFTHRLSYLDSLRGIAAVIVVFSHFGLMAPDGVRDSVQSIGAALHSVSGFGLYLLIKIHMAARGAVILFFVLSGFVLARSLSKAKAPYLQYLFKRFFRIYPALFVVVIISYLLHSFIGAPHVAPSEWINKNISNPDMSLKNLFKNLLLWGTIGSHDFDGVIWSLVHEMRISIIFPIILWSVKKLQVKAVIFWLTCSLAATFYIHSVTGYYIGGFAEWNIWLSLIDSVYFIFFFALGTYLAVSDKVLLMLKIMPKSIVYLIALLAIYSFLRSDGEGIKAATGDYIRGFGAFALIGLSLSFVRLEKALSLPPPPPPRMDGPHFIQPLSRAYADHLCGVSNFWFQIVRPGNCFNSFCCFCADRTTHGHGY